MQPLLESKIDEPLACHQSESDKWSSPETEVFYKSLLKFDKDFRNIAQEVICPMPTRKI